MDLNPPSRRRELVFVYRRLDHHAPQCRHIIKNENPPKVNIVEGEDIIVAIVSLVNMVTNVSK